MKKVMFIAALALGVLVLRAIAQNEGGPPPGGPDGFHGAPPLPPIMMALDANRDGIIDSNEIANASAALKALDKNGDGKLTIDEYLGPRPGNLPADDAEEHRPPLLPIVEALDTNHDGIISSNEIANASAALKTLDKNGDGQLTRDELFPAPPVGQRGGGSSDNPQNSVLNF